jgi:hypothetical protein
MLTATILRLFLGQIRLLPRLIWLDTPGVQATVPMLRGVWGAALRGLDPAAYDAVFSPPGQGAVPGYLVRPAPPDLELAPAVHWFLFGPGISHDGSLRRAWDVGSGMGLGPQRRRFVCREFIPLGPDGRPAPQTKPWPLADAVWPLPGPPDVTPCCLVFPAPLRLLRKGRLVETPSFADVVVSACRRIGALLEGEYRPDWERLSDECLAVARARTSRWEGSRLDLHRWSAAQQAELELRGVSGSLDLPDGPGEVWPLLAAASWVHLGKSTILGLGQLQVRPRSELR